jgi:hypothetical protein
LAWLHNLPWVFAGDLSNGGVIDIIYLATQSFLLLDMRGHSFLEYTVGCVMGFLVALLHVYELLHGLLKFLYLSL